MKKRTAIRIISFCLSLALISTGYLIKTIKKAQRYSLEIKNSYTKNFEDLGAAANNISLTLNKFQFASTEAQAKKYALSLLTEAEISKAALSQLPQNSELSTLNRFFSQVGNYAFAVAEDIGETGAITSEKATNIALLADTAEKITRLLATEAVNLGTDDGWALELEARLNSENGSGLAEALDSLEGELTDFPTLIYDGPYSDHILSKKPSLIENLPEVSEETALARAIKFCDNNAYSIAFAGNTEGHIPSYSFSGENVTVNISRAGGQTVFMRKTRELGTPILSIEQAREKAKRYLSRVELKGFRETYYFLQDGMLTVNFAFLDGETICYTDLIKVGVAMDNGEIILFEGGGYISNHKERAFVTPEYSKEQAKGILNKGLTVKGISLALIPATGSEEVRCYEFNCLAEDNTEMLVYINVKTLKEEEILILLKSDGGTLVK